MSKELASLKSRLVGIDEVLKGLLASPTLKFEEVHDKLNVIALQLQNIDLDLQQKNLSSCYIIPSAVDNVNNQLIPNVYLRSKMIPEVERLLEGRLVPELSDHDEAMKELIESYEEAYESMVMKGINLNPKAKAEKDILERMIRWTCTGKTEKD